MKPISELLQLCLDGGSHSVAINGGSGCSADALRRKTLDFAAAFGPVKGASGTVVFTDLLGLTTAPGQVLAVQSVNPGIEANDGSAREQVDSNFFGPIP